MDSLLSFLEENYIWFFVAGIVLLFALIGYIFDSKRKKKKQDETLVSNENLESAPLNNMAEENQIAQNVESTEVINQEFSNPNVNNFDENISEPVMETSNENTVFENNVVTDSNNMNYNDISMPDVNLNSTAQNNLSQTGEIIEEFNLGNPVSSEPLVSEEAINEPAISFGQPAIEQTSNFEEVNAQPVETLETIEPVKETNEEIITNTEPEDIIEIN